MDFTQLIKSRYTVRQYKDKPVEPEKLAIVLEAGRLAPTAVNYQPQRILVLDTPETLDKAKQFSAFGYDPKYAKIAKECADEVNRRNVYYYNSPTALLVCYDNTVCWRHPADGKESGEIDAAIVTVHMMLQAVELGLGTAWISYFDKENARRLLSLPENIVPVVMLLLGYADDYSTPNAKLHPDRQDISKTVFYNKYNT